MDVKNGAKLDTEVDKKWCKNEHKSDTKLDGN